MGEFIAHHRPPEGGPSQTIFFDKDDGAYTCLTEMPHKVLLQSRMVVPNGLGIFDQGYPLAILPRDFQLAHPTDGLHLEKVMVAAGFSGKDRSSLNLSRLSLSSMWVNPDAESLPKISIKHIFEPNCIDGKYQHGIEIGGRRIPLKYKSLICDGEQMMVPNGTYMRLVSVNGEAIFFEIGNKEKDTPNPELDSKITVMVAKQRDPFKIKNDQSIKPLMRVVSYQDKVYKT